MLAFCAASSVSASVSIGRGLDAMSAMKRDASRRCRLLTFGGGSDKCCDDRLGVVAEALRERPDVGLGFGFVAVRVASSMDAELLLKACVCGFAKVTPFEGRFWRIRSMLVELTHKTEQTRGCA
ncbi:hypothetical protein M3J09_001709 [Ascochyta lentis]